MTGISVERAHRILLRGANLVGSVVDELPDGSAVLERARNVRDLLTDLTWCQSSRGSAQVLHDQRLTDVLLVLFPNRELGHLAKVPLVGRPFRAENGCVAVRVTSLFLWSLEAVV